MKSSNLNKRLDSRSVFSNDILDSRLAVRYMISPSDKYKGCGNDCINTGFTRRINCPCKDGELSLDKFIESVKSPDGMDFPPYCIYVVKWRYAKSLFLISLIKRDKLW